jgi:hypothetical protein
MDFLFSEPCIHSGQGILNNYNFRVPRPKINAYLCCSLSQKCLTEGYVEKQSVLFARRLL